MMPIELLTELLETDQVTLFYLGSGPDVNKELEDALQDMLGDLLPSSIPIGKSAMFGYASVAVVNGRQS